MDDSLEVWFRIRYIVEINLAGAGEVVFFAQDSQLLISFADRLVTRLNCLCMLVKNQLTNFFKWLLKFFVISIEYRNQFPQHPCLIAMTYSFLGLKPYKKTWHLFLNLFSSISLSVVYYNNTRTLKKQSVIHLFFYLKALFFPLLPLFLLSFLPFSYFRNFLGSSVGGLCEDKQVKAPAVGEAEASTASTARTLPIEPNILYLQAREARANRSGELPGLAVFPVTSNSLWVLGSSFRSQF